MTLHGGVCVNTFSFLWLLTTSEGFQIPLILVRPLGGLCITNSLAVCSKLVAAEYATVGKKVGFPIS